MTVGILFARRDENGPKMWEGRVIPKGGFEVNPQGRNLGDPRNAEQDLRRIYSAMVAFRARTGRLPTPAELLGKGTGPSELGLQPEDLKNPDYRFSDGYVPSKNASTYGLAYLSNRANGTPKPAYPSNGDRDVWIGCRDYLRSNQFVHEDATSAFDHRGFAMILWSDGKIERVSREKMLLIPESARSFAFAYPGEAGLPSGAIGYPAHLRSSGVAKGNTVCFNGKAL